MLNKRKKYLYIKFKTNHELMANPKNIYFMAVIKNEIKPRHLAPAIRHLNEYKIIHYQPPQQKAALSIENNSKY